MNAHSVAKASLATLWQSARSDAAGWFSAAADFARTPHDVLPQAAALGRPYFFWQSADRSHSLLGVGELLRLQAAGVDRLQAVAEASRSLRAPILLGVFAFSGRGPLGRPFRSFSPADFIVPQLLCEERDGRTSLRLLGRRGPTEASGDALALLQDLLAVRATRRPYGPLRLAERPGSRDVWRDEVRRAVAAIRGGSMEKVVLGRASLALAAQPIDTAAVVQALVRREQDCQVFAVHRDGRTFLGATPERLVRVADGVAEVPCLAGTAPRGQSPAEDAALGDALLQSAKNRSEHHFVVQAVEAALRGLGLAAEVAAVPQLLRLRSLQHLHTPVRARVPACETIFSLAAALHPTPALGGLPRDAAQAWIREHEEVPRGLYGGGVGYWREDGGGEFDVAIRCALVRGRAATLWAGCGIVRDSEPEEELRETELKFRPLREALREAGRP